MIVHINCGLGNQMFQYAFAESLRLEKGFNVFYDLSWFEREDLKGSFRAMSLPVFNLKLEESNAFFRYNFYDTTFWTRVKNKLYRELYRPLIVELNPFNFDQDLIQAITERSLVYGYFQNEDYFKKYEEIIRSRFEFKVPVSKNALLYWEYVTNPNSVSVHIRRGDFLNYSDFGVCSLEYYKKAIELIYTKISNPLFVFFSDDTEWVKSEPLFQSLKKVVVEGNIGHFSYEDMRLMSMCQHNIIANSTFSWWGAWLNKNSHKIVIAPSRWFANDEMNNKSYNITPKEWVRV